MTGAGAPAEHRAVFGEGCVCSAFAGANDLDLRVVGAAFVDVIVAVDGCSGFPELLFVQAPASSLGVADAVGDPRAASIAVVATWTDLAVLLGVFALRASISVAVGVQISLVDPQLACAGGHNVPSWLGELCRLSERHGRLGTFADRPRRCLDAG